MDEFVDELVNQPPCLLGAFGPSTFRRLRSAVTGFGLCGAWGIDVLRNAAHAGKSKAHEKKSYDVIKLEDMEPLDATSSLFPNSFTAGWCPSWREDCNIFPGRARSTPSTTTDEAVISHEEVTPMCRDMPAVRHEPVAVLGCCSST